MHVSPSGRPHPSLWRIALVFLRIGTFGFGGGVGMLALMRDVLVRREKWIDDSQLGVAVALGQMLPGPFVSNYAEYIGYELRGFRGMSVAVFCLLLPSFILMCLLSWLYMRYGSVPVALRVFAGVQPVVVGILAWATVNIGRAHIRNWKGAAIAVVAFGALLLKVDVLVVIAGCGLLGILLSGAWRSLLPRRTLALAPVLPLLLALWQPGESVWRRALALGGVFLKIGAVIFGGGFAAIPFIQHEVVDVRHWLTAKEFIDGVALGQMTPGPVAITATFVGFKVLGLPGAAIATIAVFLPSFLLILILIHVYRRVSGYPLVKGFLAGVMPAVTGMLLSATVYIGMIAIHGPLAAVMALLSLALLLRFRTDPVWLVLGGALVGLAVMV
jgi:chromate transporter